MTKKWQPQTMTPRLSRCSAARRDPTSIRRRAKNCAAKGSSLPSMPPSPGAKENLDDHEARPPILRRHVAEQVNQAKCANDGLPRSTILRWSQHSVAARLTVES